MNGAPVFWILVFVPSISGAGLTYSVTEHPDACREVHVPRWTLPLAMKKDELQTNKKVITGECKYELRTPGGGRFYLSVSCLSKDRHPWRVAEKYEIDTSRPHNVTKIEEAAWQAAAGSGSLVRRPGNGGPVTEDGKEFKGRFFKKSGPQWPFEGERPYESFGSTRIVVDSWDGVIAYPGPFEIGWSEIKGRYWTDIYNVRSGQRLIQIQGTFHGVEPEEFQLQASLLGERFYVLPLQPKGMRRLLVCDLDTAEKTTSP